MPAAPDEIAQAEARAKKETRLKGLAWVLCAVAAIIGFISVFGW